MFKGIILSVIEDFGPYPRINLSHLEYQDVMRLSIAGITAIGIGHATYEFKNCLYGTFPIPNDSKDSALLFPFIVSGELSKDERVNFSGRECCIFLIYNIDFRGDILPKFSLIEKILRQETSYIYTEMQLNEFWLKRVYSILNEILLSKTPSTENGTPVKSSIVQPTDANNNLLTQTDTFEQSLEAILTERGVSVTSNPLFLNAVEPSVGSEEQEAFLQTNSQSLLKITPNLPIAYKRTIAIIYEKLGHYYYWKALKNQPSQHLKHAKTYYEAAHEILETPTLKITLASVNNKLGIDARRMMALGLEKFDKRIKLNKKLLFSPEIPMAKESIAHKP